MRKLILASASPRRHELLLAVGLEHIVYPADADETLPDGIAPEFAVCQLSQIKAQAAFEKRKAEYPDEFTDEFDNPIIIGADTIVWYRGEILGKPHTKERASQMLHVLSGKVHSVFTGVTVTDGVTVITEVVETKVRMRKWSDCEIDGYIERENPLDKAGAYGIQEAAGMFITHIEGDYFNIVGLPVAKIAEILTEHFEYPVL